MKKPGAIVAAAAAAVVVLLAGCSSSSSSEPVEVVPAPELDRADGDAYTGVATLAISGSCTATLVDTGVDGGPAYLLTNGHCLGMDGRSPNEVMIDEEGFGEATFFAFHDVPEADRVTVDVTWYEYATMYSTDVGVARLDATLGELRAKGIEPLPINPAGATSGAKVTNIAVPVSSVEPEDWVLREGACTLSKKVDIIEFKWFWPDAISNDCPGVLGGSSGSPLIADGEIVSIVNTTNGGVSAERGAVCYLGQPCEVQGDNVKFVPNTAFGVDLTGVEGCFSDGEFTLGGDCSLPTDVTPGVSGGGTYDAEGTDTADETPKIELTPPDGALTYLFKFDLKTPAKCTDAGFFADAEEVTVAAGQTETIDITLPKTEAFRFACVAVDGADPAVLIYNVDTTPPAHGPELAVNDLGDGFGIDPMFDNPEIVDIYWLTGPADSTNCADRDDYSMYIRQTLFVSKDELPLRVCAVGYDLAGNESPITDQVITADG